MGRTGVKKGRTAPKQIATMRTSAAARKKDTVEDDDSFNSEDPEKEKGKNDPNLTQPVVTPTQTGKQNRIVDGEENRPPDIEPENLYSQMNGNPSSSEREDNGFGQKMPAVGSGNNEEPEEPPGTDIVQKGVIYKIVSHHLFDKVKFFDPVRDAAYNKSNKSMCQFVLNKIGDYPEDVDPEYYWDIALRYVRVSISQLRSNRINEIKKAFYDYVNEYVGKKKVDKTSGVLPVKLPFDFKSFLGMRGSKDSYRLFFRNFVPAMNMRRGYVDKLLAAEQDKDIISVSSEAFILVVLESNWDMWMDTYIKNEKKVTGDNVIKSTVKPKYTKEAVIRENGKERKGRGWTKEGINRFNQLFQLVDQDRRKKKNKSFFINWKRKEWRIILNKYAWKKSKKKEHDVVHVGTLAYRESLCPGISGPDVEGNARKKRKMEQLLREDDEEDRNYDQNNDENEDEVLIYDEDSEEGSEEDGSSGCENPEEEPLEADEDVQDDEIDGSQEDQEIEGNPVSGDEGGE